MEDKPQRKIVPQNKRAPTYPTTPPRTPRHVAAPPNTPPVAVARVSRADSAGGGHVQPGAAETSWQRQYRMRKEAQIASGVKAGCRGCGGV